MHTCDTVKRNFTTKWTCFWWRESHQVLASLLGLDNRQREKQTRQLQNLSWDDSSNAHHHVWVTFISSFAIQWTVKVLLRSRNTENAIIQSPSLRNPWYPIRSILDTLLLSSWLAKIPCIPKTHPALTRHCYHFRKSRHPKRTHRRNCKMMVNHCSILWKSRL